MGDRGHPGIMRFFAATGAYLALLVALLSIAEFRAFAARNALWMSITFVALEAATAVVLWLLYRGAPKLADSKKLFPDEAIDRIVIRFGTNDDFVPIDAVYHEWFSPTLSIDDGEYRKLLLRGKHFRVADAVYSSGTKRLIGFYSVWPIARDTFEKLISGRLKERHMKADLIHEVGSSTAEIIYVPEICVSKESDIGATLLRDAIVYVADIAEDMPSIVAVGAWGYTEVGKSLVKRFCMRQRYRASGSKTEFYEISKEEALKLPRPRNPFLPQRTIEL